jgi:hypothetical protein
MNFNLVFALCFYINSLKLGYKNENSLKISNFRFYFRSCKRFHLFSILFYIMVHIYIKVYQKSKS